MQTLQMLVGLLLQHLALSLTAMAAAAGLAVLIVALALRLRRLYRLVSKGPVGALAPVLSVSYLIAASLFLPGPRPGVFPDAFAFAVLLLALCPGILLARSIVLAIEAADGIHAETATALALTPFQRRTLVILPQIWPAILAAARMVGGWIICAASLAPAIGQPSLGQAMVLRRLPADGAPALGALVSLGAILWVWNAAMQRLQSGASQR